MDLDLTPERHAHETFKPYQKRRRFNNEYLRNYFRRGQSLIEHPLPVEMKNPETGKMQTFSIKGAPWKRGDPTLKQDRARAGGKLRRIFSRRGS